METYIWSTPGTEASLNTFVSHQLGWIANWKGQLMLNFTNLTGLTSVAVAISAACLLLPGITRLTRTQRTILLAAVFVSTLIPLGGMPLAAYVRGVSGDLSITMLVFLCCALLRPSLGCNKDNIKVRYALLTLVALAALMLYPLALGFTSFDPYRSGYGDTWFAVALLLVALSAWVWKYYLIAICISLAVVAWAGQWYESGNLWDYLLDPWLAIYALFSITLRVARVFSSK